MKLGSLFGQPKTLASRVQQTAPPNGAVSPPNQPTAAALSAAVAKKLKPGEFAIDWPRIAPQKVKDYKPLLTRQDLEAYLDRCEKTGLAGFDWETAASRETREKWAAYFKAYQERLAAAEDDDQREALFKEFEAKRDDYLKAPLDPWKGEICTASISAAPHESRVIPIDHKKGKVFEPDLSREEARQLVMDTLARRLFQNEKIMKIAVNLSFETKYAAKYGKYILMPVADPLVMWVRCLQVVAPQKIIDHKKPATGWGLKPATKAYFGVQMGSFKGLLEKYQVDFFDEIPADQGDGLNYSAEDSDYAVQHYLYWMEIAKQIKLPDDCPNPTYNDWLHKIEMPFSRVIGLMEYWGMSWDNNLAAEKRVEAMAAQEAAAEEIKRLCLEYTGEEVDPKRTGKTGDVRHVLFNIMKLPIAKWGKPHKNTGIRQASLDEEALIDMRFMLENKLENLDEEKYLTVELPAGWENIDPETDPYLDKDTRQAIRIAKRQPHPYKEAGLALIEQMEKIQKMTTLLSSHVNGREKHQNEVTGRIHANYTPWTETARLNSMKPNGQNVPRMDNDSLGVRNFYIAGPGKILFFIDFSGFELRLLAWKSGDKVMIEIFCTGGDMHRKTAAEIAQITEDQVTKKQRTDAKPANFGIAYGGTEHALQVTIKTDYGQRKSLDECLVMVNGVKRAYPGVPQFQEDIIVDAREKGWVNTIYGYIRLLPGINSPNRYERSSAGRQAANTPIQGSAADVMKLRQNEVYDKIGEDTAGLTENPIMIHGSVDMIAQIHDEMIFEMDDDPDVVEAAWKWVQNCMEKPPLPGFPVPILAEASVGYAWGKKMPVEEWLKQKRGA